MPPSLESHFLGRNNLELYAQRWLSTDTPRAAVAIVHGFGEHSGRYPAVVERLTAAGFAVHGFDHRGHGRSPGLRGHIDGWQDYQDDVAAFLQHVASQTPGVPLFLYGHSMGALISLDFAIRHPEGLRGVILSGVPLEVAGGNPLFKAIAPLISLLAPKVTLNTGLDQSAISRDPEAVKAYQADPLVHGLASARWGAESMTASARLQNSCTELTLPVLILHGGADRLCAPVGSEMLYKQAASADKELHIYPDGYHEPHNDLQRAQVLDDVQRWLERRLA